MILQTNNENSIKASLLVSSQVLSVSDDYVVVDIETTGLSPQYDEIIEIAAIKYKFGEKADVFSTDIAEFIDANASCGVKHFLQCRVYPFIYGLSVGQFHQFHFIIIRNVIPFVD